MPDTQVVNRVVSLALCQPHPKNYNEHTADQIEKLRAYIREFGQVRSIVVQASADGGGYTIVAGHGISAAMRLEGYTEVKADVIPADWTAAKVKAYLVVDNESAKQSKPNDLLLADLLGDIAREADEKLAILAAGTEDRLRQLRLKMKRSNADNRFGSIFAPRPDETQASLPKPPDQPAHPAGPPPDRYPLAVVLNNQEWRRWQDLKLKLNLTSDKSVVLYFMEMIDNDA